MTPRAGQNFHIARISSDGHVKSVIMCAHLLFFNSNRETRVRNGVNDRRHVKTGMANYRARKKARSTRGESPECAL